jgi:hypothetical protein
MNKEQIGQIEDVIEKIINDRLDDLVAKCNPKFNSCAGCLTLSVPFGGEVGDNFEFNFDQLLPEDKNQRKAVLDLIKQYIDDYY